MGLFDKIKDILFVDEEDIPVITQKEEKSEPVKSEPKDVPPYRSRSIKRDVEVSNNIERESELPKEEVKKSSPFMSFDEKEFERVNYPNSGREQARPSMSQAPRRTEDTVIKTTTTNIKRVDYKDYSRYEMTKTVEEKKPFRPSPVISPVYGILDKNYRKEDVVDKPKTENTLIRDVDSIRKKAFGEDIEIPEVKKADDKSIDDLILDEFDNNEETTVEDVIVNSIDEKDMVDDIEPIITHYDDVDEEDTDTDSASDSQESSEEGGDYQVVDEHTSALEILDEIEKELNKQDTTSKKETLEGDLFNLIDSMYDDRKDEDK